MAQHKHGKRGKVFMNGDEYNALEWDGDDGGEAVEVSGTMSLGSQEMDEDGDLDKFNGSVTFIALKTQAAPRCGMVNLVLYEGGSTAATDATAFKAYLGPIKRGNKVKSSDPTVWVAQYKSSGPINRGSATVINPYVPS